MKELESAHVYEDLVLFSLDNGRGSFTMTVVNFNKVMVNFIRRVMTSLQQPKALASQSPTMIMVNS